VSVEGVMNELVSVAEGHVAAVIEAKRTSGMPLFALISETVPCVSNGTSVSSPNLVNSERIFLNVQESHVQKVVL
jgi:hypothetical protein